jgi:hypothetical protein
MAAKKAAKKFTRFKIGKFYFVRGVTLYYVGRAVHVDEQFLTLDQCAWVADTGRFAEALKTGKLSEVEPYPDGPVNIGIGSICDASEWHGEAQRIVL